MGFGERGCVVEIRAWVEAESRLTCTQRSPSEQPKKLTIAPVNPPVSSESRLWNFIAIAGRTTPDLKTSFPGSTCAICMSAGAGAVLCGEAARQPLKSQLAVLYLYQVPGTVRVASALHLCEY